MSRPLTACFAFVTLFACGGMPPPVQQQPAPMTTPPTTTTMNQTTQQTSPNILGVCTNHQSPCANGRGICLALNLNPGESGQCIAKCDQSWKCANNAFCASTGEGEGVCLDRCLSVRDCSAGQFCNPTVLAAAPGGRGTDVQVCLPGKMSQHGKSCDTTSECQYGSTDLACVGANGANQGICTKGCNATSECGEALCIKDSMGRGSCVRSCSSDLECGGNNVCDRGICLPKAASSTSFPTPAFGKVGGGCASSSNCEGSLVCLTSKPGGFCTGTCTTNSQCGDGVCVFTSQSSGLCYAKCSAPGTQSNCRSGFSCSALQNLSHGACM